RQLVPSRRPRASSPRPRPQATATGSRCSRSPSLPLARSSTSLLPSFEGHSTLSPDRRSGVRKRLPILEAPLDQRRPFGSVVAVQHGHVTWLGTDVDPRRPRVEGICVRARRPVAGGAIDAFELDLTGPPELGSVGMTGTFAVPEVEDGGRF